MVTDAAVIGNQVDGALFVVRSSYAPAESVEAAVKKLKDTGVKVLGAVLTRYDAKTALKGSNYAYNYYSYGYSYGTPPPRWIRRHRKARKSESTQSQPKG